MWLHFNRVSLLLAFIGGNGINGKKALDVSPDITKKTNDITFASLEKNNLPASFTICTVFMVEQWDVQS